MKALIIGANGFVGTSLTERLLKEKWAVKVLVRSKSKVSRLMRENGLREEDIYVGDVSDLNLLKKATSGIDVVFNCAAALPHHHLSDKDYWQVNVDGVKSVMEACRLSKVKKVVHISTAGIYGPSWNNLTNEKSEHNINDIYLKTKLEGEKIVWKYIKEGYLAVIIKPATVYGQGGARPVFLTLFTLIKKNMFVSVGRGDNYFHTVYIENLVDALLLAATNNAAVGEDFIIGDYPCSTMKQIINTIAEVQSKKLYCFYIPTVIAFVAATVFDFFERFGLPVPLDTRRVKFMTQNKRFSIKKAQKVLGYKPKISFNEGIKRTFAWYKKEGLL